MSLAAVATVVARLAPPTGASVVGLDFDATAAWPVYNWMGVCKAGLESLSRYLARDLGPAGIRVNLVAAGPIHTRSRPDTMGLVTGIGMQTVATLSPTGDGTNRFDL